MSASLEDVARLRRDIAELKALVIGNDAERKKDFEAFRSMAFKFEAGDAVLNGLARALVCTSPASRAELVHAFHAALEATERQAADHFPKDYVFWLEHMKAAALELLGEHLPGRQNH